jgi:hypothetical protein
MTPTSEEIEKQEARPLAVCAECNAAVIVHDGRYFRTCEHIEAQIVANMTAILEATGGVG